MQGEDYAYARLEQLLGWCAWLACLLAVARLIWIGGLFWQDGKTTTIAFGRYIDQLERRGGEWQPLTTRAIRPHSWDEVRPRGTLPMRVRFDAVGLAEPARLLLVHGDAEAELNVGADGEVRIAP